MLPHTKTAILLGLGVASGSATLGVAAARGPSAMSVAMWVWIVFAAALLGFGCAWILSRVSRALRRDVRRLAAFVRDLPDEPDRHAPTLGFGLEPIAASAAQRIGGLGANVQELTRFRRESELRTRVSEAERGHLEAVLNAISDGVVVTDAFNEVSLANGAAARALRFELEPALRRPLDEVTEDALLVKLIKDTRDAGPAVRRSVEHRLRDEAVYQVTTTCVGDGNPMGGAGGGGVVTVLRDVTKDKEIAAMKSDFVSKVSHELRTPLSSIKAYIELLIDGEAHDEATRTEFYNIVQSETERLQRLIDNILSISRIESGVTKVQREPVPLEGIARDCLDVLQPQADAKAINVTPPSPVPNTVVHADRDMIYQAALNLVSNAIKYTPEGGSIVLSLESDAAKRVAALVVRDSGAGIPAEDVPLLFQKFYRVASNNRLAKGTGLGLSLVKHVVETVHDGRVFVESRVGEGSTFKLVLPMADNPCIAQGGARKL